MGEREGEWVVGIAVRTEGRHGATLRLFGPPVREAPPFPAVAALEPERAASIETVVTEPLVRGEWPRLGSVPGPAAEPDRWGAPWCRGHVERDAARYFLFRPLGDEDNPEREATWEAYAASPYGQSWGGLGHPGFVTTMIAYAWYGRGPLPERGPVVRDGVEVVHDDVFWRTPGSPADPGPRPVAGGVYRVPAPGGGWVPMVVGGLAGRMDLVLHVFGPPRSGEPDPGALSRLRRSDAALSFAGSAARIRAGLWPLVARIGPRPGEDWGADWHRMTPHPDVPARNLVGFRTATRWGVESVVREVRLTDEAEWAALRPEDERDVFEARATEEHLAPLGW